MLGNPAPDYAVAHASCLRQYGRTSGSYGTIRIQGFNSLIGRTTRYGTACTGLFARIYQVGYYLPYR